MKTIPIAAMLLVAFASPVLAQPAPSPAPTSPADDPLYACGKRTGPIAVTFKPETELKDLITWVMGFTCKNFILDPRIVSMGKKVTVIAPLKTGPVVSLTVIVWVALDKLPQASVA